MYSVQTRLNSALGTTAFISVSKTASHSWAGGNSHCIACSRISFSDNSGRWSDTFSAYFCKLIISSPDPLSNAKERKNSSGFSLKPYRFMYRLNAICDLLKASVKLQVRHTLERKKRFFVFSFQTLSSCTMNSYKII